jgi:hypothetical protein
MLAVFSKIRSLEWISIYEIVLSIHRQVFGFFAAVAG